ncbi:Sugar phosphate permease [Reichenbachiella faecimaris]|uniref:Lysosomal dipeptide transporter MFSD1 n=1 Tax=Reichenbachiella faecimaris TaxID=692418 RepID=A0A1W2GN09_REIFA|nr:MFS transporter [Reichenbachiella faecimaris]SMD38049.1 Sugar phosphate permease [Reichenbachiella faecimaris]
MNNSFFQSRSGSKALKLTLLILAGESIFFLPFVLARVFRPTFLAVFEITNLELGSLYSVYGVVAMVAYFLGGPLADRFSPRLLIASALLSTGFGGFCLAFAHSLSSLLWLYGFWGMTTILLFWAALIKATRSIGGSYSQGRAFGFLEGGRGFIAAFAGSVAVGIFSFYLNNESEPATLAEQQMAFRYVIYFFSGWVIVIGLLIWFFFRKTDHPKTERHNKISLKQMTLIAKEPKIWLQAIIIVCAYVGYKITDDFSLLAKDVLAYSDVEAAQVGALALWMRMIVAITAGFLADRIAQSSKVISWGFATMIFSGLAIGSGLLPHQIPYYYIFVILSTCVGVYAVRGLYFSLIQEALIPLEISGTSIGLISVIGFTPDIFMGPLMGYFLDENPGALGHQLVFMLLAGFAFIGLLATTWFRKLNRAS